MLLRERSWPKHRRECSLPREHRKQKDRRPSQREGMQRLKFSYVPCAFAVSFGISVSSRDALADQQADEPEVTERQRPVRPQVRALPREQRSSVSGSVALPFLHFGFLGLGLVAVLLVLLTSPLSLFFSSRSEHRRQAKGPLSRRRGISCLRFSYRSAEALGTEMSH